MRKRRILAFAAAAVFLAAFGSPAREQEKPAYVTAWWGVMYPQYCFGETGSEDPQLSFWLAEALDW